MTHNQHRLNDFVHQYDEYHYQNQQQQHHEDHTQDDNHDDNRNTGPGVLANPETCELILRAYRENIGPEITGAVAKIIEDAISSGMDIDTVIMAIEETGLAPRPSAFYLRAILRNWAMDGEAYSRIHNSRREIPNVRRWWKVTHADIVRRQRSPAMSDDELGPI